MGDTRGRSSWYPVFRGGVSRGAYVEDETPFTFWRVFNSIHGYV
jgi:hypothetical protein